MAGIGAAVAALASLSSCASRSVGDLPLLQETLDGRCARHEVKECIVSGGNRFAKRYEYCGCRRV